MTAPVGHSGFISKESIKAEKIHRKIIKEEVDKNFPELSIRDGLPIAYLMSNPENQEYSFIKTGDSQTWKADGGWIFKGEKLVGVAECKYQEARENACERAARYAVLRDFKGNNLHRIFISCHGPGFTKINGGGNTGPMIDVYRDSGMIVLENPDKEQLRSAAKSWLESL